MNNYKYLAPTAGVTYANEDGSSRQEIIASICRNDQSNEYHFIATLKPTTYVNQQNVTEEAIAVYAGTKQIGFVARKDIEMMRGVSTVVAIASYYGPAKKYTVNLYKHEVPSAKQYAYAKSICYKNGWALPLYTQQDYTKFLTAYEKQL